MKYQEHIKKIQREYFERYNKLKEENPNLKGKDIWIMLESQYDFTMYSTYDCFRTSYYLYNKKNRECQKQTSTSV
jgi:hypothetical protein